MVAAFLMLALAQAPSAKVEFEKATTLFNAKNFEEALPHFRRAYELSGKRPSTILALAQCERVLGRIDDALVHFHEYVATDPPDKAAVKETIELLEAKPPPPAVEAPPPPPLVAPPPPVVVTAPPPVDEETSLVEEPVFWILIGAGVLVVAGGVALGVGLSGGEVDPYGGSSGVVIRPRVMD